MEQTALYDGLALGVDRVGSKTLQEAAFRRPPPPSKQTSKPPFEACVEASFEAPLPQAPIFHRHPRPLPAMGGGP